MADHLTTESWGKNTSDVTTFANRRHEELHVPVAIVVQELIRLPDPIRLVRTLGGYQGVARND
jgi:hypothetical protein